MGAIISANRRYDRLPEPWRFVTFMAAICLPLTFGAVFAPISSFAISLALILMRVWWLQIGCRR